MSAVVTLAHGSGGRASQELVAAVFLPVFGHQHPGRLEDCAVFGPLAGRLALSTDSYVVDPIFFPGGDIGALAVHGTVNDLAMRGARPLCLAVAMILEEGLPLDDLGRIVQSMKEAADRAGVAIVTGDTKVLPAGKADRIFITTTGIGLVEEGIDISCAAGRPGDCVLVSGSMGDHGATILCQREGFGIGGAFASDTAPLNGMVMALVKALGPALHVLRDPTRGGLATTLNELATAAGIGIVIEEGAVPLKPQVRGACEFLGLDPLYLANEGKLVALVAPERAAAALAILRSSTYGADSARIGTATVEHPGQVLIKTPAGGSRILDMLHGQPLPRIC